jgi:hypothetical protein
MRLDDDHTRALSPEAVSAARDLSPDRLRTELRGEMAELRAEVRGLTPKVVVAHLISMVGLSGVLLGARVVGG